MNQYFANWARNKDNKYFPLIGYLTGVLGFPEELAKAEIARNWTASGAKASGDGTDTHLQIELCLNNEAHASDSPEFKQYQAWHATHPTWRPYRTRVPARTCASNRQLTRPRSEWSVFNEEALICGQVDSLWVDDTGAYHMADWKRVAEMKTEGFRGECGHPPLQALPNTNLGHYTLQQNVYTWMLEQKYGIKVASMCLVQVHPDIPTFKEHALPRIDREVDLIMAKRRERVAAGELVALDAEAVKASAAGGGGGHKRKAESPLECKRREKLLAHLRKMVAELEGEP